MSKRIAALSLFVVWCLALAAAYYIGYNKGTYDTKRAIKEQFREVARKSGRPSPPFSPGDSDPRGN